MAKTEPTSACANTIFLCKCMICMLLCTLVVCFLPLPCQAGKVWVLQQKTYSRGDMTVKLSDSALLVTLNTGAQAFATAPDWTVIFSNAESKKYCRLNANAFTSVGINALTTTHSPQYSDSSSMTRLIEKSGVICSHPALCFYTRLPAPYAAEVKDPLYLSGNRTKPYARNLKFWLPTDIFIDRRESMILSTIFSLDFAFDRPILMAESNMSDGSKLAEIQTMSITNQDKSLSFDPNILKFKRVSSASEVVYSARKTESDNFVDGFGFGK